MDAIPSAMTPVQAAPALSVTANRPALPTAAAAPAPAPASDDARQGAAATSERLKAAVARANQELAQSNREMTFVFDDKVGRMLVKIVDKQTNTVVRQVPSEDMLAMARALQDAPTRGALIKSRA
jgi:flagellar protein FlaG